MPGFKQLHPIRCTRLCCRRRGSRDVPVKVRLEVDWQPERYQLSQGLASLLGMELETRARVIEVRTGGTAVLVMPGNAAHVVCELCGLCLGSGRLPVSIRCAPAAWRSMSPHSIRSQAVWSYVRRYKCQTPEDPTRVICNARLKALFEEDSFDVSSLAQRLSKHLSPAPAVTLEYTIR